MKKKLVIISSIICIIAGGYFTMEYLKHKEKKEIFWKAQEARVTKYIHYNVKNVKSITFTKQDVSPMGVPKLKGYINKDENLWFVAHISTTENFEDDFGCSGELYDNYVKKPEKSISEIEKEEKEKKKE
ncbi:DUF1433 domain-containing protein [Bacillus sp. AY3-1]|uniref:Uncharacterized protein n=1 Tax=Bacillus wiedmannii TaxID=1890302 RepID=A0A242Z901_9BACI|nr:MULTISPECIES: DUF1433 domain-containing protein [Bacillus cereus group]OUB45622.1 hypothetical protein BK740_11030 [Bacillus thuringiensis serovar argentinensis]KAA0745208.1 DUF1433 domain-containing protein [Bacillus sp. AY3-1]MCP9278614.1 DUF1433 domain-containing protein [Bacillus wiedmannii]MED3122616.1 DUF1433 domain-containing protein [Bacillus wiedmannii]OTX88773.1 hypothetical protein BK730_15115 [Bacillus wiedmannii]